MRVTSAETAGSGDSIARNPWRSALRLTRDLPRTVRGPVLFLALARLASTRFADIIAVAPRACAQASLSPALTAVWGGAAAARRRAVARRKTAAWRSVGVRSGDGTTEVP